ncbi:MAG TPA: flagellar filament capping protein FliD, partial [Candidatus Glassbacteria bacterium]|nr:flagellar filament capping protein FliD [Candidatus Glassbacteria bacterium]
LTVNELGANNGILKRVFGLGTDTTTTSNATSDSADFSLVATFFERGSNSSTARRVISGTKENYRTVGVNDLIDGVTIIGATLGQVFSPGSARVQVNNSSGMAIENSAKTNVFGRIGITDSAFATGLGLDADGSGTIGLNRAISDLSAAGAFSYDDGLGITAGTFKVGSSTLTITQDELDNGLTLAEILARINSANQGITVGYEAGTDRFIASSSKYGSDTTFTFGSYTGASGESNVLKVLGLVNAPTEISLSVGTGSGRIDDNTELAQAGFSIRPTSGVFSINGIGIEVDITSDTLSDIIDKINNSGAGVTASLDSASNRISLVQNVDVDTTATTIKVGSSSDTSNLLKALRITAGANVDASVVRIEPPKAASVVGTPRTTAEIEVDGVHYSRNSNTIEDITPGLTYNLRGLSDSPITVTVSGDKDRALEAIARWVVEYNKTVKLLNPARIAQSDRKYLDPLSDQERSTLTFNELVDRLDKFTQYNKSETIRRDSNFKVLDSQLRDSVFARVSNASSQYASLA